MCDLDLDPAPCGEVTYLGQGKWSRTWVSVQELDEWEATECPDCGGPAWLAAEYLEDQAQRRHQVWYCDECQREREEIRPAASGGGEE